MSSLARAAHGTATGGSGGNAASSARRKSKPASKRMVIGQMDLEDDDGGDGDDFESSHAANDRKQHSHSHTGINSHAHAAQHDDVQHQHHSTTSGLLSARLGQHPQSTTVTTSALWEENAMEMDLHHDQQQQHTHHQNNKQQPIRGRNKFTIYQGEALPPPAPEREPTINRSTSQQQQQHASTAIQNHYQYHDQQLQKQQQYHSRHYSLTVGESNNRMQPPPQHQQQPQYCEQNRLVQEIMMDVDDEVDGHFANAIDHHNPQHQHPSLSFPQHPHSHLQQAQAHHTNGSPSPIVQQSSPYSSSSMFLPPLIVMDGANIAHAYVAAKMQRQDYGNNVIGITTTSNANGGTGNSLAMHSDAGGRKNHPPITTEPDAHGIRIAAEYFLNHPIPYLLDHGGVDADNDSVTLAQAACRVLVVIPAHWLRRKPQPSDLLQKENALMVTSQLECLQELSAQGLVCAAPPTDDDDAYVLAIARRADAKQQQRVARMLQQQQKQEAETQQALLAAQQMSGNPFQPIIPPPSPNTHAMIAVPKFRGAYVLSNDLFRDAIRRDDHSHSRPQQAQENNINLQEWLQKDTTTGMGFPSQGPGRISSTFCDMGSVCEDTGEAQLDLMPNPRHPLVARIEATAVQQASYQA
jgi:hypothetical protein